MVMVKVGILNLQGAVSEHYDMARKAVEKLGVDVDVVPVRYADDVRTCDGIIISGGENLYPVQIEDELRKFDKIKDVAVIGLPDARLGEIAAAIIEIKQDMTCTEEEINEFCQDLPRYKRPRKIVFEKVPRNPTGKIEKPKLRKIYCGESVVATQVEINKK